MFSSGSKDDQLSAVRGLETQLHQLGIKYFGEEGSWEALGRGFQFFRSLVRTGTLSSEAMDAWVASKPLYSKSAGKRKVGAALDLAQDVAKGVMVYQSPAQTLSKVSPLGSTSPRRVPSRSRSASAVLSPSPTARVGSSPVSRGGSSFVMVEVPFKASSTSKEGGSIPAPSPVRPTSDVDPVAGPSSAGADEPVKVVLKSPLFFDPPTPLTSSEDNELDDVVAPEVEDNTPTAPEVVAPVVVAPVVVDEYVEMKDE